MQEQYCRVVCFTFRMFRVSRNCIPSEGPEGMSSGPGLWPGRDGKLLKILVWVIIVMWQNSNAGERYRGSFHIAAGCGR